MASLLDAIKKRTQQAVQPQPAPNLQQDIQQTLRAKSGKVALGGGPRMSDIQQRAGIAQGQAQLQQVQQGAELQQAGLEQQQAAQQQQLEQGRQDIQQRLKAQKQQLNQQTTKILNDLERQKKTLSQQEKNAKMEEASFLLGLQNDQYINELQRAGALRRLENENNFKEELIKASLGEDRKLYEDNLDFQRMINADERTFKKEMQQMSIDQAWDIFRQEMKAQRTQAIMQGLGGMATGLLSYYANTQANPTPQPQGGGPAPLTPEG